MTTKTVRTAGSYLRVIEHRIGSPETELDHVVSLNQAVSILESARAWEWMQNNTATVTLVAGQGYVELPTDVRDVVSVQRSAGLSQWFAPATLPEIQLARASSTLIQATLWHHTREVYSGSTRTFRARLELYPTPTTADAATPVSLVYHARIPRVSADDDQIIIPDWLDPIFEELVVAVAQAREEPELGGVEQRVAPLLDGRLFRIAAERDGSLHDMGGPWSGGAVNVQRARQQTYNLGRAWRLDN